MKTLIKKEIRLLLPAWITAMLLAIVPGVLDLLWVANAGDYGPGDLTLAAFVQLIFAAGVLFLGINSFGEELSCNTFSALLAQPIDRRRLWRVKIATLAGAFASVWLAAVLIFFVRFMFLDQPDLWDAFGAPAGLLTLSALVAFSGGLWTTLLLRQTATAFWFTLLTPLAIILALCTMLENRIDNGESISTAIVIALVLYSIAGFLVAWRLFMRAQDVQWTGGEISLPFGQGATKASWRRGTHLRSEATGGQVAALPGRPGHWLSALAWKEVQLHQSALLIAVFVLVLHLTAYFIRKFHPHLENSNLEFVVETIWMLWLLMPLLIGAAAIAEERRTGTLGPQLCLPVSRHVQLLIKFCVGLLLSLFFGALMPVFIEGTTRLDTDWNLIFYATAALFFISFYASSLARTALQGIGLAILMSLWVICELNWVFGANRQPSGSSFVELNFCFTTAVLAFVLGGLTLSNFKENHNSKFWARNIAAIVAVSYFLYLLTPKIVSLRVLD